MQSTRGNLSRQKYLVIDTESVWDPYLREAYADIDKKNEQPRIGCRRLLAISLWPLEFDGLDRLSTGPLHTFVATEGRSEADILTEAFNVMRRYSDHVIVGHGTIAHDCQIMILAAMAADMELPAQLKEPTGPRWRDLRHIDVGLALKGGGKTWHHQTELLLRLGLPVGLMLGKADPNVRENCVQWDRLTEHCEKDVLFAAMTLVAWLRLQGKVSGTISGMLLALCEVFLRRRPHAICAPLLRRYADELLQRIVPHDCAA
ncbi:hypothetical protein AAG594_14240 [Citromicrobium bathyomarinum]